MNIGKDNIDFMPHELLNRFGGGISLQDIKLEILRFTE
jgi:hypothetical protein